MVMAYNNFMKPEELIRHFGDVEKAAAGVGVTPARSINGLRLGDSTVTPERY
ncbi:Cro/Cl family transcriptional regulator [Klebsiella phage Kpn74]|uniref:Cro/Cl family transcriptional regulator n=1 Tax=Klebsiella phage Kpn74 TaxID=3044026 RepID=A0AAT9V589_9CAUD|nr:Cro/Cl family transcriptional regulator [Klebsiella phage Kpn74]